VFEPASPGPSNGGKSRHAALRARDRGRNAAVGQGSPTLKKPLRFAYGHGESRDLFASAHWACLHQLAKQLHRRLHNVLADIRRRDDEQRKAGLFLLRALEFLLNHALAPLDANPLVAGRALLEAIAAATTEPSATFAYVEVGAVLGGNVCLAFVADHLEPPLS